MEKGTVVVGVFTDRQQAEQAVRELYRAYFRDVGYVAREENADTQAIPLVAINKAEGNAAFVGIISGIFLGMLVGLGCALFFANKIPGGLLTLVLAGLIIGALVGWGLGSWFSIGEGEDEESADQGSNRIIIIVQADDRPLEAFRILERYRGVNLTHQSHFNSTVVREDDPEATIELKTLDENEPTY